MFPQVMRTFKNVSDFNQFDVIPTNVKEKTRNFPFAQCVCTSFNVAFIRVEKASNYVIQLVGSEDSIAIHVWSGSILKCIFEQVSLEITHMKTQLANR